MGESRLFIAQRIDRVGVGSLYRLRKVMWQAQRKQVQQTGDNLECSNSEASLGLLFDYFFQRN